MIEEFYLTWSLFRVASSVVTLTCTMYCSRVGYFTQLASSKVDNTKCNSWQTTIIVIKCQLHIKFLAQFKTIKNSVD